MSNSLDLLLAADISKVKRPSKEVEMTRLSKIAGGKVTFLCESITDEEYQEIRESIGEGKINELYIFSILKGVKNPDLKNKALCEKYGVPTPKELVQKMLLPGEILQLYNIITELSGFGDDAVEEIKN